MRADGQAGGRTGRRTCAETRRRTSRRTDGPGAGQSDGQIDRRTRIPSRWLLPVSVVKHLGEAVGTCIYYLSVYYVSLGPLRAIGTKPTLE